jgi:hypothetical protein
MYVVSAFRRTNRFLLLRLDHVQVEGAQSHRAWVARQLPGNIALCGLQCTAISRITRVNRRFTVAMMLASLRKLVREVRMARTRASLLAARPLFHSNGEPKIIDRLSGNSRVNKGAGDRPRSAHTCTTIFVMAVQNVPF